MGIIYRKSAKGSLESKKTEEQRKTELQEQNRALTPKRHYPCLGVAEQAFTLSPIQHSMPRRDARRLGVDGAARGLALHQASTPRRGPKCLGVIVSSLSSTKDLTTHA
ncbi:hypothetical protein PIB30_085837 [Stylosanthes scabra]|uniref:Uncharacterized protein n=1 Tax=Stylosanthes scabra TaxID=79078 RepID=A0ABU6WU66_9FABA|nr:hypothetical protein [Stylosanthes scabra]